MQLVIGSTYESSRGFGRLLYLGETHGIDGYLPTFRTSKGEFKHYRYDQLPSALVEFSVPTVSRADELIACLEGEIAKRDEELAACRVAVENCELFRAELAALKAQEPALPKDAILVGRSELALVRNALTLDCEQGRPIRGEMLAELDASIDRFDNLYAAPVSEAKAQGVVMPERLTYSQGDRRYVNGWNDALSQVNAAPVQQPKCKTCDDNGRIGGPSFYAPDEGGEPCPDCSTPVQQVSVPDGWKLVPVEPTKAMLFACEDSSHD